MSFSGDDDTFEISYGHKSLKKDEGKDNYAKAFDYGFDLVNFNAFGHAHAPAPVEGSNTHPYFIRNAKSEFLKCDSNNY